MCDPGSGGTEFPAGVCGFRDDLSYRVPAFLLRVFAPSPWTRPVSGKSAMTKSRLYSSKHILVDWREERHKLVVHSKFEIQKSTPMELISTL